MNANIICDELDKYTKWFNSATLSRTKTNYAHLKWAAQNNTRN